VPGTALTVGELVGYLRVDSTAWRRGLADARAGLDGLAKYSSRELDTLVDTSDRAAAGFVRLALAVSNVATAAWAAQGVGSVVSGLGGALAVLPALGVAVGVGMAAAHVGMAGFGDAMKAVEDPAKFAESLERLSPAARDTAVAVRDLAPAWRSVQQVTQEALFSGVADDVRALGARYLPVLETGLSGVAGEFNNAAHGTAAFLGQSRQVETVSGIFGQVRASVGGVTAAVPPLVSILLDLVAVGSEFLPGLSGGFASAAQRAAEFVREARETGQLHEWIASGLATLRQLGELLANVGGIASAVFSGLDLGGAGLLGTLVALTGQVREFLESVQGQEALAAFGEVLSTVSDVVAEVLLTALRQLAPVVIALAPGFAQLATQVGSVLVAALTVAGPLLVQLATFLSQNASWLGPLAIGLYAAAKAFDAVIIAVRLLNIVSMANPWVLIIAATVALATLIITNWDDITQAVGAAWRWLSDRAAEVWGWIERNIVEHIANAARWVGDRIGDVLDFFGWLGSLPGKAAEWFGSVARWAGDKLSEVVVFFRDLPGNILGALGDLGSLLVDAGRDIVLGLLRGLKDFAGKIWEWVKGLAQQIWDEIVEFFDIFSPSKKMRYAGRMIGLGLASGLDATTGTVTSSAADLARAGAVTVPAPVIGTARPSAPMPGTAAQAGAPAAVGTERGSLVHIEHYHPPADATPGQVATDLDWLMRAGGR
jgi:hypothetical protein